ICSIFIFILFTFTIIHNIFIYYYYVYTPIGPGAIRSIYVLSYYTCCVPKISHCTSYQLLRYLLFSSAGSSLRALPVFVWTQGDPEPCQAISSSASQNCPRILRRSHHFVTHP